MKSTKVGVEILTKAEREGRAQRRADRQRQRQQEAAGEEHLDIDGDPGVLRPDPAGRAAGDYLRM
jgi:hypothetical protein